MLNVITDNLDVWTTAQKQKKAVGRGRAKKDESYGIKKLRELILESAVRGKLVPQDANDEPASVLLERIAEEKLYLIDKGMIKKQKVLPEITEDEKPFELPNGWEWAKLGSSGVSSTGKTPSTKNEDYYGEDVAFIGPGQITKDGEILEPEKLLSESGCEYSVLAKVNDILMVCIGGSIGKSAITSSIVAFNQQINCISPLLITSRYLFSTLNSPHFQMMILEKASGSATPIINRSKWEQLLVPIPPLAEQHRIVAKVDELMALCDQLEQEQADHQSTHQTLVETLLNGLIESAKTNANNQQSTADYFNQLIAEHFDTLFTTEQSIEKLKQTILQLAVMGKLVPQDPNDEPASVLLEKIAKEKTKLIEEGKIKKQKALPEITEDEKPFELPSGWEVCCLGHIVNLVSGQHLKPSEYSEQKLEEMIPYLTGPAEFGIKSPSPSRFTKEHKAVALEGNILITCKGSGVGKLNIAKEATAISRQLMSLQPVIVSTDFTLLLAESLNTAIREKVVGIAIPGISREDVTESKIALPPFAEQLRIVTKVNQLLTLCETLKANLNQSQTTQTQLADAIVKQAVN